jgi:hypothetical protein
LSAIDGAYTPGELGAATFFPLTTFQRRKNPPVPPLPAAQ